MVTAARSMMRSAKAALVRAWVTAMPSRVVSAVQMLRGKYTYNEDSLAVTAHACAFLDDERFANAYRLGRATGSWGHAEVRYRAYVCCWAAERASRLEGDFVECGVNKGGLALTVMNYVGFEALRKRFYLLDTFAGLNPDQVSQEERERGILDAYRYEECYDQVRNTFGQYENVRIVRGTVPTTLPLVDAEKVSYLSLDMNCAEPEIAAAEFFWDRLVSGAAIVLDDYGWSRQAAQRRAFDTFARRRDVSVLELPTGQGLILRP